MEIVPNELAAAASAARERLAGFARTVATVDAGPGSPRESLAMGDAARAAVFADALFAAMHARLEELKGVAK